MRETKECRPSLLRKPMLIWTQRQGLSLQVQLLPTSVQKFATLVSSTWCTETKHFFAPRAARTLEWHLVSEKNSKTSRPDQSEIA
jgi:hypothetical protein